jgi:hypothetical protein
MIKGEPYRIRALYSMKVRPSPGENDGSWWRPETIVPISAPAYDGAAMAALATGGWETSMLWRGSTSAGALGSSKAECAVKRAVPSSAVVAFD